MIVEHPYNDADRGKPKYWNRNLSLCHSPRNEPGFHGKKPATNILNTARLEL
jgi:hypothetical protein